MADSQWGAVQRNADQRLLTVEWLSHFSLPGVCIAAVFTISTRMVSSVLTHIPHYWGSSSWKQWLTTVNFGSTLWHHAYLWIFKSGLNIGQISKQEHTQVWLVLVAPDQWLPRWLFSPQKLLEEISNYLDKLTTYSESKVLLSSWIISDTSYSDI